MYDYDVGDCVPENAMTSYDSLRGIINRYNKLVDKERRIDSKIVDLRDAIAHGRVSALPSSPHFLLIQYSKSNNGVERVQFSQNLNEKWLKEQVNRTKAAVDVV